MGVLTEHIIPTLGNCLATAMLLSPTPAVMAMRRAGKLGDINPLPYPMTCVNAMGWIAYGLSNGNPYLFPANVVAFIAGLFFTFSAYPLAARKSQDIILGLLLIASAHFITLGLIGLYGMTQKGADTMWGLNAVIILMCYYVIPLSTLAGIVRSRNAASIYPPLAVTAIANGTMWTVYGLAIGDTNIWVPNGFGSIIGVAQLVLRLVYGARPTAAAPTLAAEAGELAAAAHADVHHAAAPEGRRDSATGLLSGHHHGYSSHQSHNHHSGALDVEQPAGGHGAGANGGGLYGSAAAGKGAHG